MPVPGHTSNIASNYKYDANFTFGIRQREANPKQQEKKKHDYPKV
jgi:hypothetical protein